jgi:hypothetical protein
VGGVSDADTACHPEPRLQRIVASGSETPPTDFLQAQLTCPVGLSVGRQVLSLERPVRFRHGVLMTEWWNWQTHDAQNVVP